MRTAEICPTCSTYTNAVCVIYDGPFLSNIGASPMDNLEYILGLIDSSIGALGGGTTINHIPYSEEIGLSASGNKTIYVIDDIVTADIYFTLDNPGEQSIGDQLFVMSKPNSTGGDITYTYDPLYFYMTDCGDPSNPPESFFDAGEQERDVTVFTFDGEVFVATWDNC